MQLNVNSIASDYFVLALGSQREICTNQINEDHLNILIWSFRMELTLTSKDYLTNVLQSRGDFHQLTISGDHRSIKTSSPQYTEHKKTLK